MKPSKIHQFWKHLWSDNVFQEVHGTSDWMGRYEKYLFLNRKNQGLVLGDKSQRLSLEATYAHTAIIAPSGAGKSSRFIIPSILLAETSFVCVDPSSEIYHNTSGYLASRGFKIHRINPTDLARSDCFNPLIHLKTHREIKQLSIALSKCNNKDSPQFWTARSATIFSQIITALVNQGIEKYLNLANVLWIVETIMQPDKREGVALFMKQYLNEKMYNSFRSFISQDEKALQGILGTASNALDLWTDEEVCSFTASNTIDLAGMRKQKTAVYLTVPESDIEYYGFLLNLFYKSSFNQAIKDQLDENSIPIQYIIEECGNIGAIEGFSMYINVIRKRKCGITIVLQSTSQLAHLYGQDAAEAIYNGGINTKIFLPGLGSPKFRKEVEAMLGEYTESYMTSDKSKHLMGSPLMNADEIRKMKVNEAIVVHFNRDPLKLKTKMYFEDSELKSYSAIDLGTFDTEKPETMTSSRAFPIQIIEKLEKIDQVKLAQFLGLEEGRFQNPSIPARNMREVECVSFEKRRESND